MTQEKSYTQMQQEFQELFYREIAPRMKKYEKTRKIILISAIGIVLLLFGIAGLILKNITDDEFALKLGVVALLLFFAIIVGCVGCKVILEQIIKKEIMPIVCGFFPNLSWTNGRYDSSQIFEDSGLITDYDSVTYDDIFKGAFKDVNFDIIESEFIKIERKREYSEETKSWEEKETKVTQFDGVIVKLDMNKKIQGNTVITRAAYVPKLKRTVLEDVEFGKKFNVFTEDEIEARYLITPTFMERMKNVQTSFSSKIYSCAFYDKYILIALSTSKDLFSLGSLFASTDDSKQFFTMYEEIVSIMQLIDHFKLDQRIGM